MELWIFDKKRGRRSILSTSGDAHPLAPLEGELSAKLTERLLQICRERPKPQIQFAVWKGRNEHRGKETSRAAARSVVVISDAPPAALSFPLRGKR